MFKLWNKVSIFEASLDLQIYLLNNIFCISTDIENISTNEIKLIKKKQISVYIGINIFKRRYRSIALGKCLLTFHKSMNLKSRKLNIHARMQQTYQFDYRVNLENPAISININKKEEVN